MSKTVIVADLWVYVRIPVSLTIKVMTSIIGKIQYWKDSEYRNGGSGLKMYELQHHVASGEQKLRRDTDYVGIGRIPTRAGVSTTHRSRHPGVCAAAGSVQRGISRPW